MLGGQGVIVQVDESLFRHKPKITQKHVVNPILILQHHSGRATTSEVWVFGIVDTSYQPALGYMEIVQCRDAATLLPIIQAHTAPGSIVHSDDWAAYHTGVYTSWGMWLPTML